ncbi:GNAT family N-acetyltransferase [Dyella sp. BiH032]|uniref:GNAT family N-acetyltransferase n=1 Tax=Dyella sp. BiH032 TaxID=3075430 RepID=UPI002892A228|nr:GNAT family N-acetyltransferase [Dyella sp. BiH032]WNL44950.1 GNAT family N-acetyltransferase [Dyella sp. BiH032]
MIELRDALAADADAIAQLLDVLGYPGTAPFIRTRIAQLLAHPDARLVVAADGARVVGVISLHFLPQLALAGDFCRISYLCVDESARGGGIGAMLEARAAALARARGCDRIELHCHARRTDAHRFYERQGYSESPRYYAKSMTDA